MRSIQLPANPPVLAATAPSTIATAASILRNGGVVAIPTDTVYGLAASLLRPDAITRLYDMKSRPTSKAIPILVSDFDQVSRVAVPSPPIVNFLAHRFWPGGLTLVVEARTGLPSQVISTDREGRRTVAVRLPDHPVARQLIDAAGGALAVTSANRSGERDAVTASQARKFAIVEPDAVVDGGRAAGGIPSTVMSVVGPTIAILREGAVPANEIRAFLAGLGYGPEVFPAGAV